jgi:hypothetical protein
MAAGPEVEVALVEALDVPVPLAPAELLASAAFVASVAFVTAAAVIVRAGWQRQRQRAQRGGQRNCGDFEAFHLRLQVADCHRDILNNGLAGAGMTGGKESV